jgi:hypothetical protein
MQAVKLRIKGEIWDSQLADGRLVLFGRGGDIRVLDWDGLINGLKVDGSLKSELLWTCCRNDMLYRTRANLGNPGSDVWQLLRDKFDSLSALTIDVSLENQDRHLLSRVDNRFPFPHRDSAINGSHLYVASQHGLHSADRASRGKRFLEMPVRLLDVGGFAVRPKHGSLAIAAGDEGLFEFDLEHERSGRRERLTKLSKHNCVDCGWTYWSIYGSSFKSPGYLTSSNKEFSRPARGAQQSRIPDRSSDLAEPHYFESQRERRKPLFLTEDVIFKARGYSWGTQNSICQVEGDTVRIMKYSPRAHNQSQMLKDLGTVQIAGWKGDILSGRVALFGIIIECEEALVIKLSSGDVVTLPGEIVRFRTFPESRRYENQMHVVYEDRLEIFAFTHDYFIDQQTKKLGYRV